MTGNGHSQVGNRLAADQKSFLLEEHPKLRCDRHVSFSTQGGVCMELRIDKLSKRYHSGISRSGRGFDLPFLGND
jgi:hypothetical protein